MIPRRPDAGNGFKRHFLVNGDAVPLTPRGDSDELRTSNTNQQQCDRYDCTIKEQAI
jgi:hypothetical protein